VSPSQNLRVLIITFQQLYGGMFWVLANAGRLFPTAVPGLGHWVIDKPADSA
jgi:hypothetical protein